MQELNTTQTVLTQADKIYLDLIEACKAGLDGLLTGLQAEFVRLFEKLHPNEGFQAISLVISKEKRSSIGMESTILGHQSMHPYGNYSEGHLDSLGLCLFLAFIRSFNTDFKLIVLDDVLTSIDAGHRIRVARLLAEDFSDYQIILTTHDEMWANELKIMMSSRGLKLRFLRFKPWDLSRGSDIDEFVASDWLFYQQLVNAGRKQDAIAGVGRSLEKFLFQMRRNLGVSIPVTFNDVYTIGDLYGPFFTWVDKHHFTRADRPDVTNDLKNCKEELDGYWRLRNWSGAHYNEWGATVSPSEAKSFIQIVEELIGIFECPVCTGLVVFDRNANLLHCPVCEPTPTQDIIWVYRPDWRERAQRLVQPGPRQNYRSSVGLIRSAFELFLRDMRWIARLAVSPVQGDRYRVQDLFVPFSQWARQHPNQKDIGGAFERMADFLDEQNCWQEESLLIPRAEQLYQVVDELLKVFECPTCKTLMHYSDRYYCPQCSGNVDETPTKQPALWPVVRTT